MRLLILSLLLGLAANAPALAQTCSSNDVPPQAIAWPDDGDPDTAPVWELEFLPPSSSTGIVGSGLEIRNVRYNGRSVLKRGHVPILNVKYETGCDCYRDWNYSDQRFQADNEVSACHAESTAGTVQTMCDAAPSNCTDTNGDGEPDSCSDIGSFSGVAVERFEDQLVLTTQFSAGWYRYTMRWTFFADGTIHPRFGFTSTGSSCTQNPRRHHAYWRFDFDIEDADHDYVVETDGDGEIVETFQTEATRTWGEPSDGISWSVLDLETERGYRVAPGAKDYLTPTNPETGIPAIDEFAREDAVIAAYKPGELDDGIAFEGSSPNCDAEFEGGGNATRAIVNGEDAYDTDVVFWYRSGSTKPDIDPGTCYVVGPVLTALGDWSAEPPPPVATDDTAAPTGFSLADPYPNPFDGTTTVSFTVEEAQELTLTLYDSVGRTVRTLWSGTATAGAEETVVIDGADLPSGTYTVRMEGAEGASLSKRIVLVK